jgi:hypothetical protein
MIRLLFFKSTLVTMFITSLVACGGGGDGTSYPDLSYTGVQTQAIIDPDNANAFASVILEGGSDSTNIPLLGGATVNPQPSTGLPDSESLNRLSNLAADILKNKMSNSGGALVTGETSSINGNCGGSMTISGEDTGSSISATVTMDNFCESDGFGNTFTSHGRMTLNATYTGTSNNPTFTSMQINIEYLKLTFNDGVTVESEEFSGSISATFDGLGNPDSITLSVNFKYEGQIFKIANFNVDEAAGTIEARLYHPDHGYVDITTTSAFTYDTFNEEFCDGSLQITGSDGLGGTVVVDFTDYSCTTYDICYTINADPQVCAISNPNTYGTEPVWP